MRPEARRVSFASRLNLGTPLRDTFMDAGLTFAREAWQPFGHQPPGCE
jgi:hypothetical protein